MRKNLLALSIAAMVGGLSGAANAAVLNTSPAGAVLAPTTTGVGHILVVPYFTTQGNFKSLLNIVNTDTVNGKAVKLRYRGAANSDDLFDITIYLSPGDMWTADVAADADGYSRLVTNDTSCTLPSIADIKSDSNGRFKTSRVRGGLASETREGYIEILNTANVPPATSGANSALYTAIKHVNGKAPCTSTVMDLQENDLTSVADATARGYAAPTGGLAANWVLVNVEGVASHSGSAYAIRAQANNIDGVANGTNVAGNIVWFPQTVNTPAYPAGGDVTWFTADPLLAQTSFASQVANYDFPDLSTPYTTPVGANAAVTQADELTRAMATASVSNEYLTASGFGTDWVFSMPTRRYHVAMNYAASGANRMVARTSGWFSTANTSLSADANLICVTPGALRGYDREESTQTTFVISPSQGLKLCGETSVLSFNNTGASVLGAQIARNNVATRYAEGWMTIATPAVAGTSANLTAPNNTTIGLPVIGFAAAKVNGNNLGGTWEHRYSR